MTVIATLPLQLDVSEVMAVLKGFDEKDEAAAVAAGTRKPENPEARKMLQGLVRALGG